MDALRTRPKLPLGKRQNDDHLRGSPHSRSSNEADSYGLLAGADDCSYYQRACKYSPGIYYCFIAPPQCDRKWPLPKPIERCIRKCLQDSDWLCRQAPPCNMYACELTTHSFCWSTCIVAYSTAK